MAQFKRFMFFFGHTLIAAYVVLMLALSVFPIKAQSVTQYQIGSLDRRVGELESLNLDRRLALLEQALMDLRDNNTLHRITMGGTGLLIAERVYAAIRKGVSDGAKES